MAKQVEYWKWWVEDEVTGKPRRTTYVMDLETALSRYPTAYPDEATREIRTVYGPGEAPDNTKPPSAAA